MTISVTDIDAIDKPLRGECRLQGDKSISIRLAMLGPFAPGTYVRNMSNSPLVETVLKGMSSLGAAISRDKPGVMGFSGFTGGIRSGDLHCGSSATFMRLITGLLSGLQGEWQISGNAQLTKRPMDRVEEPLRLMGADVWTSLGFPPIGVKGSQLHGIEYELPISSAQVKSSLLLAGLNASGKTSLFESRMTRDHTERIFTAFGIEVEKRVRNDGSYGVRISGPAKMNAIEYQVPGDISSAANIIVLALLTPGSDIVVKDVLLNPTRTGFVKHLIAMGADMEIIRQDETSCEPVGDIHVKHKGRLQNKAITSEMVPGMIDELPLLAIAGAFSEGRFELNGGEELRLKESDRIKSTVFNLTKLGVDVEESRDGFSFTGWQEMKPAVFDSFSDHRIALACLVAGSVYGGCSITNEEASRLSFTDFKSIISSLTYE